MKPPALPSFTKLPNTWIEQRGLWNFRWGRGGEGVDNLSALMVFTALMHRMDVRDGTVRLTYDELQEATGLARATVSRGLSAAADHRLITRPGTGRSHFQVEDYESDRGWAMFPVNSMYRGGAISAFKDFNLRRPAELEMLKFFFLCVSRRDRSTNTANITYEKIHFYSGIAPNNIKRATSGASSLNLVFMEQLQRGPGLYGVSNAYRVAGIFPRRHSGTMRDPADFTVDPADFSNASAPWDNTLRPDRVAFLNGE